MTCRLSNSTFSTGFRRFRRDRRLPRCPSPFNDHRRYRWRALTFRNAKNAPAMHGSVAGRTRRLDPCRTCRESDRQATGTVVLLSEVADADSPETISLALAPAHFPTPLRAPGPRGYFDETTRSRAEGGTGPSIHALQDPNPPTQGAYARGTEVACGCPNRVEPHAEGITHGRSGFPWAEK